MPGFSRMEQQRLARIVLAHRGKLAKMQRRGAGGSDWTLVFALRLASLILRSRTDVKLPLLRVAGDDGGFAIELPQCLAGRQPAVGGRAGGRGGTLEGGRHEARRERPVRQEGLGAAADVR